MGYSDGGGLSDPGPLRKTVAAEKPRLALHLPQVQAAQQRLSGLGGLVEGHDRVDTLVTQGAVSG